MNVRLALMATVLTLSCVTAGNAQEKRMHGFGSVAISPDGTSVVSVETTDPGPNAKAPAPERIVIRSRSGGASVTIGCPATVACRLSSPVWSPDGSRIAYLQRDITTSNFAIWTADADGSHRKPWLATYAGVLDAPRWSPDGSTLAVLATAGAHKDTGATSAGAAITGEISTTLVQDVQRIATIAENGTLTYASPADLFVYEYDWMPDGRGFAATGAHGNGDDNWWIAKLYTVDAATATATVRYTPALQIGRPRVSPDGTKIAFIGGLMSDFVAIGGDIYVVPTVGGDATDVTPGFAGSANAISWQGRNDRITFTALVGDSAALDAVDPVTKTVTTRWSAPESISADSVLRVSLARDGSTSALVRETFERAPEIYTGAVGKWTPLTHDNVGIAPAVRAQSVSWTNEGHHVQGWLLAPRNIASGKKYPMIVEIHGGPSSAATPNFVSPGGIKDRIDRGYFVFLPNPRGSYGQGEKFTAANVKDFGYGDLRDVLSGLDAVEKIAPVDDHRLGVTGFSYGGYMTMWTVTQTNRFKAAVAGAGIANWQSYYGENGIDTWMLPFFGASVYDDPAVYAKSSPIAFVKNVKTPTFIYVGERDVECPAPQSEEFWHALVTLGVPTSLVIYAGEGHGFHVPQDRTDSAARSLAWFDKYLK